LGMGETVKRWNVNYGGSNIDPSIVEQVELFKDQINYYCIEMMDVELLTMINKEVTKFLENKQGPEDAAQAIDRQINLYLKE